VTGLYELSGEAGDHVQAAFLPSQPPQQDAPGRAYIAPYSTPVTKPYVPNTRRKCNEQRY
jgi:hypothetical protein